MWLPWQYAAMGAVLLGAAGVALGGRTDRWGAVGAVLREVALMAVLYSMWQLAGRLSVVHLEGAKWRGEKLWDLERAVKLPDEGEWQRAILDHPLLVQASNIYYGGAHVPGMGIFLVWMFFWHRDRYKPWRNALAALTAACLVVQLLPVAPPRLIPGLGVVDTGILYHQSVYSAFGSTVAGQLQAMPSLHAGWAILIAIAVWQVASGPWRWLGILHAALTVYVIAITGNHYWADSIVAGVILLAVIAIQRGLRLRRRRAADSCQLAADLCPSTLDEYASSTYGADGTT